MKTKILTFIKENNLSPFLTSTYKKKPNPIFKTKDAKKIHNKTLEILKKRYNYKDTGCILDYLDTEKNIIQKQEFFRSTELKQEQIFLKNIKKTIPSWKPKYSITAATEEENTYAKLKKLDIPVYYITCPADISTLNDYDIIQVIDCPRSKIALENLPQTVFISDIDDIFLEKHLINLSAWKQNIQSIPKNLFSSRDRLSNLLHLLHDQEKKISLTDIDQELNDLNSKLSSSLTNITIEGKALFEMMDKRSFPKKVQTLIETIIKESGHPELYTKTIPIKYDENLVQKKLKDQETSFHTAFSEKIKKNAEEIKKIPDLIESLIQNLIYHDFISNLDLSGNYPRLNDQLSIKDSKNIFLSNPLPISFNLNEKYRCSILTGANSGGKTTLLEHLIQLITLSMIGLPISGQITLPEFTDIYYFAKNKGSMNKGAFETLLTQMSGINPKKKALILADELESVTEPGVAAGIICATAEYFINKGCYMIFATHLGQEIIKSLPKNTRIDGIEAKGLDDRFNLIVDHNPILGRIANSTPELIIEKLAKTKDEPYFSYIHKYIKK